MYEHILIATDGRSRTQHAIEQGIEIAEEHGAAIHALYVIDLKESDVERYPGNSGLSLTGGRKDGGDRPPPDSPIYRLKAAGEEAIQEVVALAESNGVEAKGVVLSEKPHRAILDYVRDNGIDLIVVGTGDTGGLKRAIRGSTASKVYTDADVPVLVCNPDGSKRELSADDVSADRSGSDEDHKESAIDDHTPLNTDELDDMSANEGH